LFAAIAPPSISPENVPRPPTSENRESWGKATEPRT
jgi:hypothetical protein